MRQQRPWLRTQSQAPSREGSGRWNPTLWQVLTERCGTCHSAEQARVHSHCTSCVRRSCVCTSACAARGQPSPCVRTARALVSSPPLSQCRHTTTQNPTVATHTQLVEVRCATDVRSEEQCVSGTRNPPPQVARPKAGRQVQPARPDPARAASPPQRELGKAAFLVWCEKWGGKF